MTELQQKRQERRKETAEDFTPDPLVNEMLDKLPEEVWQDTSKTFLDNSAGNGNFLVAVLQRKLDSGHEPLVHGQRLFGVQDAPQLERRGKASPTGGGCPEDREQGAA